MADTRLWYRVVHIGGGKVRSLGRVPDVRPNHHSLDPFLSRLLLAGVERGELALIDERTGLVAARRLVRPRRRDS
ncbi:MAG: hypothetical protein QOF33_4883 [Thermomicrobiales bacterium]|jgi:hypothetical protein|nr:hypothetical protein [Thermomicrobiales bacterium]MEA2528169.1 hypothetical protein [Thermomicrobiales bacterium]MEA2586798.1 hypothetical protein [Thermomicrobiales bacterium]MEA2598103.1 hypothetical protein [Thermomicrobiales bacterium]